MITLKIDRFGTAFHEKHFSVVFPTNRSGESWLNTREGSQSDNIEGGYWMRGWFPESVPHAQVRVLVKMRDLAKQIVSEPRQLRRERALLEVLSSRNMFLPLSCKLGVQPCWTRVIA